MDAEREWEWSGELELEKSKGMTSRWSRASERTCLGRTRRGRVPCPVRRHARSVPPGLPSGNARGDMERPGQIFFGSPKSWGATFLLGGGWGSKKGGGLFPRWVFPPELPRGGGEGGGDP